MKSKSRYLIHFFLVFLSGIFFVLVFLPKPTLGIADCCPISSGEVLCRDPAYCSGHILECCYPGCPFQNWTSTAMSACQANLGSPTEFCCKSSSCSGTACGTIRYWDWCHAGDCQVRADPFTAGACQYQYKYTYDSCAATDTCVATKYLKAGLCDTGGCSKGGFYKICCEVNASGNFTGNICPHVCSGSNYTGTCGSGCNPVIGSSCPAGPSPTPGPTPTPTPTPPPDWGSCWCRDPVANYCNLECCWGTASDCPGKVAAPTNCCEGGGPAECEDVDWIEPPEEQSCPGGTTPSLLSFPNANLGFETGSLSPWHLVYGPANVGGGILGFDNSKEGSFFLRDSTYSDDEFRVEQVISGLTPGKSYLVSVWGRARSTRPDSDDPCLAKNEPQIKLESGSNVNSWVYISRTRGEWREQVRGITVPQGVDWIEVKLRTDCICDCWGHCLQSAMDWVRIYECATPTPPTCSVSLSSSSVEYPNPVAANVTGNANRAGNTPIRLWVERQDSAQITPAPGAVYYQASTGKYYYQLGECISPNSAPCSASFSVSLPVSSYYFHCDVPNIPNQCSGNPFCCHEGLYTPPNCIDCAGWVSCSDSDNKTFSVTSLGPWFQTKGGDVHGNSDVGTTIPPSLSTYFSLEPPGVVSTGDDFIGTGIETKMSVPGWRVEDGTEVISGFGTNQTKYDYDYFDKKIESPSSLSENPTGTDLNNLDGFYKVGGSGNLTITSPLAVSSTKKIVILVPASLRVSNRITVAEGGFVAFIVSQDIIIDPNIGNNPASANRDDPVAEGVFIANGTIDTQVGVSTHERFVGRGMFVADADLDGSGGFTLRRDLGANNGTFAAEYFEYRPDFLVNFPREMATKRMTWREVAP